MPEVVAGADHQLHRFTSMAEIQDVKAGLEVQIIHAIADANGGGGIVIARADGCPTKINARFRVRYSQFHGAIKRVRQIVLEPEYAGEI